MIDRKRTVAAMVAAVGFACASALPAAAEPATWAPFPVYEWDPPFDMASPRTQQMYEPLESAENDWLICVSIPHLKDAYWLAVNYGIVDEAKRLGVRVKLYEAGGYGNLGDQIKQVETCIDHDPDALIVSAVEISGLDQVLAKAHDAGIPIVDLINGVTFPHVSAKSIADYYDNGFKAGEYLLEKHTGETREIRVLWFPGPKGAGWAQRGDQGFNDALAGSNIKILETGYGDTGKRDQARLIEAALLRHPNVDYIVGATVAAEAATEIVRRKRIKDATKVVAYYFGPGVHRGIKRGTILAAPSDLQAIQGRIALDQAVRIIEEKPYRKHVGPQIQVVDRASLRAFDLSTSLAPRGFTATFDVN